MRLHNRLLERAPLPSLWRGAWLTAADALDARAARLSREWVQGAANAVRSVRRVAPLTVPGGPATPHQLVAEHQVARLLRYPARADGASTSTEAAPPVMPVLPVLPVLIVASLIKRYYALDLLPEVSAIDLLCRRGLDVWVLDWRAPGGLGPSLGFGDYVDGAIPWAAGIIAARTGAPQVSLLGYSMGGTLAVMAAARHPEAFAALALLATPVDFAASGRLAEWIARGRFDADALMDLTGNLPGVMLHGSRPRPLDDLATVARVGLGRDDAAARHRLAVQAWLDDDVAFPGGLYREYIRRLYHDNALCKGTMTVDGTPVDLGRITQPLLVVTAEHDRVCAPPSSEALLPLTRSVSERLLSFPTDHIGLAVGRRAHATLWPAIADWLPTGHWT